MKLHVLIDNLPAQDSAQQPAGANGSYTNHTLASEHGLSFLLQTPQGENFLIDTGAGGGFIGNMQLLKDAFPGNFCCIGEVNGVFISHGHNDHTGGLRKFIEANTSAPIWLHNSIQGNLFFSCRNRGASATTAGVMEARSIGMEQSLFAEYGDRFVQISEPTAITGNITLIPMGDSSLSHPMPLGNKYLYKNDFPDDFSHETAILVEFAPEQYAVISPCSHRGILNILDRCTQFLTIMTSSQGADCKKVPIRTSSQGAKIRYFIGGLHYVDYLGEEETKKEAAQIVQAAEYIREHYPNLKVFSGHCTGSAAREVLQDALKENYQHFCTGTTIELK